MVVALGGLLPTDAPIVDEPGTAVGLLMNLDIVTLGASRPKTPAVHIEALHDAQVGAHAHGDQGIHHRFSAVEAQVVLESGVRVDVQAGEVRHAADIYRYSVALLMVESPQNAFAVRQSGSAHVSYSLPADVSARIRPEFP